MVSIVQHLINAPLIYDYDLVNINRLVGYRLGNICLSANAYGWMTNRVMECADPYSRCRILSLLEGGYDLQALPECVAIHLRRLQKSLA